MLLAVFMFHYFSMPRITLRLNKTFLVILSIEMLIMLSDYLSCRVDEKYQDYSCNILYSLNMIYFVLFFMRVFWFYRFSLDALRMMFRKSKWKFWLSREAIL